MKPHAATRLLQPAPDPLAALVGLAAAQGEGAEIEPFFLGGDLALYGESPRPFTLLGATPVARLVAGSAAGRRDADFPWQREAAGFFRSLSAFLERSGRTSRRGRTAASEPPFSEGVVVGWIGHELPATRLVRHDTLAYFDHRVGEAKVLAMSRPDLSPEEADREAEARAARFASELPGAAMLGESLLRAFRVRPGTAGPSGSWRPVSPREYARRVTRVLEKIAAGDVYQVNLSQPLRLPLRATDPVSLARAFVDLLRANPVPYPAFIMEGGTAVLALSPERYIARRGEVLESRPIKGTRPRGATPARDRELAAELAASAKDRAENIMIVDLVRNDLGQVARTGSVEVAALAELESFASVHHLVSTVRARARPGVSVADVLAAVHPAGSMTGAPKIRAVEILSRLEREPRGPYAGGIGWFAPGGDFDLAMVIRSVVVRGQQATLRVGGGVVADSVPEAEYRETLDKARSLLEALDAGGHLSGEGVP